jgi:hypothetical protein
LHPPVHCPVRSTTSTCDRPPTDRAGEFYVIDQPFFDSPTAGQASDHGNL